MRGFHATSVNIGRFETPGRVSPHPQCLTVSDCSGSVSGVTVELFYIVTTRYYKKIVIDEAA